MTHEAPAQLFGEPVLRLRAPDGTALALVGVDELGAEPAWIAEEVPAAHAIRGLHGVTLLLDTAKATAGVLTDVLAPARSGGRAT